jgi:diguanylate cyclase (GGDEF)-like protein
MDDRHPGREEGPDTGRERDIAAQRRDESSTARDRMAAGRDREARDWDVREELADRHPLGMDELRGRGRASRRRAAGDRTQAGLDRQHAVGDREHGRSDRRRAAYDRDQAGTDELTGARRRGVGLHELNTEMQRARRESDNLVAAFVDVDGLKAVNDKRGHAAGDEVLRTVADGFRRHMRPYDLLVRIGGDEFLCALPDVTAVEAQRRFDGVRSELQDSAGTTVSIGYSELRDGDSSHDLVTRADAALLAHRKD